MDLIKTASEKTAAATVVLLSMCYFSYTAFMICISPPENHVQFVPDDAYYYMTLARNFVDHSQWTFDSGVSRTTGFHPLHAYALVAVEGLTNPSEAQFVRFGMIMSFALALLSVFAAALFTIRTARLIPGMVLLLFVLSRNISLNTISVVEWGWVVILSVLYCYSLSCLDKHRSKTTLGIVFLFGLLGSCARTDFGILPAALAVASIPAARTPAGRSRLISAIIGLGGASFGVIIVLCRNYLTTGQVLQSSARMKSLWLDTYGPSVRPILGEVLSLFGDDPRALIPVGMIALCAAILAVRRFVPVLFFSNSHKETSTVARADTTQATLWFGCLLAIVGYVLFYSMNPVIQIWYTAGIVVPLFLVLNLPFVNTRSKHPLYIGAFTLLVFLVAMQLPHAKNFLSQPEWPHQISMFRAGRFLKKANIEGRVGSWNAGIIGYYEGGNVVNLDGLVNNDIYEYVRANDLPQYIDERGVRYILDFDKIFLGETAKKRGI